jgi:hypothetical protein
MALVVVWDCFCVLVSFVGSVIEQKLNKEITKIDFFKTRKFYAIKEEFKVKIPVERK